MARRTKLFFATDLHGSSKCFRKFVNAGPIYRADVLVLGCMSMAFLPGSIYLISRMPSDPRAADVVPIVVVSLVLAFAATLYPSWRASRVNPAEALRYE